MHTHNRMHILRPLVCEHAQPPPPPLSPPSPLPPRIPPPLLVRGWGHVCVSVRECEHARAHARLCVCVRARRRKRVCVRAREREREQVLLGATLLAVGIGLQGTPPTPPPTPPTSPSTRLRPAPSSCLSFPHPSHTPPSAWSAGARLCVAR